MDFLDTLIKIIRAERKGVSSESKRDSTRSDSATEAASETELPLRWNSRKKTLYEPIESHDGRVQQAELVDLTGWSKSSVSRYLCELESDGVVTRIQLGRSKVVFFSDDPRVDDLSYSDSTH